MATLETYEKISLDRMTEKSVSVLIQTFAVINGTETLLNNHRRAFTNDSDGIAAISEYLPEPYLSAVMAVWGDTAVAAEEEQDDAEASSTEAEGSEESQ